MKKSTRMEWAKETVSICEAGFYLDGNGNRVDAAVTSNNAAEGTVMYSPGDTI